jgi:hypothetical protein
MNISFFRGENAYLRRNFNEIDIEVLRLESLRRHEVNRFYNFIDYY